MIAKLRRLAERIEFIDHLDAIVVEFRKYRTGKTVDEPLGDGRTKRRVEYTLNLWEHDFAGVDFDMDALALYLSLTCIDTIKGKEPFMDAFDWLSRKQLPPDGQPDWTGLKLEYQVAHGIGRLFKEAFTHDLDDEAKSDLVRNLAVVRAAKGVVLPDAGEAWLRLPAEEKLKKVAASLYEIRCKFTHTSIRAFSPEVPVSMLGGLDKDVLLRRVDGPPLPKMLRKTAVRLTRMLLLNKEPTP